MIENGTIFVIMHVIQNSDGRRKCASADKRKKIQIQSERDSVISTSINPLPCTQTLWKV